MADELIETRQAFLDLTLLWEWIKGLGGKFRSNINEWPSVSNSCRVMNVLLERECQFAMLGWSSLDSGNCLKSLVMVTSGHA